MRPTRFLRFLALAGVLPLLGACSESTTPQEPLATTYVLISIDGAFSPLVLADVTTQGGFRQRYTMLYDTLTFQSPTVARRSLRALVETNDPFGGLVPVVENGFEYFGSVRRRDDRVILEYDDHRGSAVKPDTFMLRETRLVKMGPYGVSCAGCAAVRQVEYVYEPR